MKYMQKQLYTTLLTLLLSTTSFADCSYELFSISSAKNTKIIDFIDQLSDECGFSIIVTDPNAEKFLNTNLNKTNLKNLTIDEVLNIILLENNLSYTLVDNLLKISYLTTKVFEIDYILSQRKSTGSTDVTLSSSAAPQGGMNGSMGGSSTAGAMGGGANGMMGTQAGASSNSQTGIKIESTDEVKFWEALDLEFQSILNRPHDSYKASAPIINKNAGLITVTATSKQMNRFEGYLKRLQDKVQLQVLIDVQLLSVTMNEGETTGIDWKQLYALQNFEVGINTIDHQNVSEFTGNDITTLAVAADTIKGVSKMVNIKATASLNEVIKFLQTQGDVSAISNPKVLTLNNQPALITAGTEYFYKIQTATNQQGSSGGVAATTQNDNVQSVFAGVLLTITPEISDDKTITLKINPSLSETTQDISTTNNSGRDMPPDLNRRQLSSVVTVKDGNRIILGGLINTKSIYEGNKVPILGDIPIISYLFKYEEKIKQVEELVIIIEPHIIQKEKSSVSLSDLGYEGLDEDMFVTNIIKETKKSSDKLSIEK
ncbi:pilus (MSHA type) biogenesis protein MshL [Sulfurimonas aquatica]|uniref:Pilus (MSHA type) biogenesis protein MshL n=1 Tax=Sulfurimonas aquatica TaxID=2672570 RepID=A0A975GCN5_9BACT|nr:pilus (MSHA type) biogenesis protein MshL [Sulfurimonas aquatica]QSZ41498.1 pilus (MSHA type) biogenesis protein MshL [Sulfurimonas aquatica]